MMEDSNIAFWTSAILHISDFKHGILVKQCFSEVFENGVWLFVQGKNALIQIESKIYTIRSNALFHIVGNHQIHLDTDSEAEYFIVEYQAQLPPNLSREATIFLLKNDPAKRTLSFRLKNSAFVAMQFSQMADAWNQGNEIEKFHMKQLFYAVLYHAFREYSVGHSDRIAVDTFEQAKLYLKEHFDQANLVQRLADSLGVTRASLHEQFRRRLGLSPKQFIMQLRLDAACYALSKTDRSMDEIAACCGLRDKSYFSRVFKQKYGLSPGVYRKTHSSEREHLDEHFKKHFSSVSDRKEYLLIENFGRLHRYYGIPKRVVCLDYSAAEFCAALGIGDRLVGIASAESSIVDCKEEYRLILSKVPFIYGRSADLNVPDFETVKSFRPDIVIGSSYSFQVQGGVEDAAAFERIGIHIYALQATCVLGSTFDDVYADIRNLGRIFGREEQAEKLVDSLRAEERLLPDVSRYEPIRIFCFDTIIQEKAFTCGQSLESYMLHRAGGKNIFEDRPKQFVQVDWSEVAQANPQVILVHRFHERENSCSKIEFLKRVSEIADTDAIRNHRFFTVGIKNVFPSMEVISTTRKISEWLA